MFFTANAILIVMKHTSMFVDLITILSDTLQFINRVTSLSYDL